MLTAELEADGKIISATDDTWQTCLLNARENNAERISHSREIIEVYHINDEYYSWRLGIADFVSAATVIDEPEYLPHRSTLPTLEKHVFDNLVSFGSCYIDHDKKLKPYFYENMNAEYYKKVTERPVADCRRTVDYSGGISLVRDENKLTMSGEEDKFLFFDGGESFVGFISIDVCSEKGGIVDIVRGEGIMPDGELPYHFGCVTRLHIPAGHTRFVAIEPGIARYVKIYWFFIKTGVRKKKNEP